MDDVHVVESQEHEALFLELALPLDVFVLHVVVRPTVQLDDRASPQADEIDDVALDRILESEAQSIKPLALESGLEHSLGLCRRPPILTSEFGQVLWSSKHVASL